MRIASHRLRLSMAKKFPDNRKREPRLAIFLNMTARIRVIGSDPLRLAPVEELRDERDRAIGGIGRVGHLAMELDDIRPRQLGKLSLGPAGKQMKLCYAPIFFGSPLLAPGVDMILEKPLKDFAETVAHFGQASLESRVLADSSLA